VVTAGVIVISLSYLRMSTEFLGMGYQPFEYENNGPLVRKNQLLLPVDKITAGLYGALSERAFAVDEPLAKWHPDLADEGHALRINNGSGKSRNTIRASEFSIVKRFIVGGAGSNLAELISDRWTPGPQPVLDVEGKQPDPNSRIEGFVINFKAGAGEKSGKVVMGAGQIRLLCTSQDGEKRAVYFPIAVSSQAEGDKPLFARWRYDGREVFISSVGGGAEAFFAFEFVVPPDMQPIALSVRGTRVPVTSSTDDLKLSSAALRDAAIVALPTIIKGGAGGGPLDTSQVVALKVPQNATLPEGLRVDAGIGTTLQLGLHNPLEVDEEGSGVNKNQILGGEWTYATPDVKKMPIGLEAPLRILRYRVADDVQLVHVDVSADTAFSLLGPVASQMDRTLPPLIIDANEQAYSCIGYWYEDEVLTKLRYTNDRPVTRLEDLERLSRSRPDQRLRLIFRVTKGVRIKYFAIGDKAIVEFTPSIEVKGF
jgi:hypothetical protein